MPLPLSRWLRRFGPLKPLTWKRVALGFAGAIAVISSYWSIRLQFTVEPSDSGLAVIGPLLSLILGTLSISIAALPQTIPAGLTFFLLLRALRLDRWWHYLLAGAVTGGLAELVLLVWVYASGPPGLSFHPYPTVLYRSDQMTYMAYGAAFAGILWLGIYGPHRALIATAAVTGCALLSAAVFQEMRPSRLAGDSYSTNPVAVDLGERGYLIPRNYIRHLRRTPGGKDDDILLFLLLPALEPLTAENRDRWYLRKPGTDTVRQNIEMIVHLSLRSFGAPTQSKFGWRAELPGRVIDMAAQHAGLDRLAFVADDPAVAYYTPRESFHITPSGNALVFECGSGGSVMFGSIELSPRCETTFQLHDGVWLSYRFHPNQLPQWLEIDNGIRELVRSFRQ